MAIPSRRNQYRGINAHLHSLTPAEPSDWPVFHSAHVVHLAEAIDARLPAGYVVAPEKSRPIHDQLPSYPDGEADPPQMDTYSPPDQARIHTRMRAVSAAQRQGLDLEQRPFPIEEESV